LIHCSSSLRPLKFALVMSARLSNVPNAAAYEQGTVLRD